MKPEKEEALPPLPDYVPMDHEALTSIHLPGGVVSDTKARQQYARNVERKAVDYYAAQIRAALAQRQQAAPSDDELNDICESVMGRFYWRNSAYQQDMLRDLVKRGMALAQRQQVPDAVAALLRIASRLENMGRPQAANGVRLAVLALEKDAALTAAAPSVQPVDREELLGDAIRALIAGDIKCSDDLPPDSRPVHASARRAFGAVRELMQRTAAPSAQAELRMIECPGCGMEFADGALHNANLELHRLKKAAQAEPQVPLTDEQIDAIVDSGGSKAGTASVWSAYDFARAIERAHGIGK